MAIESWSESGVVTICVDKHFGFDDYRDFREAYRHTDGAGVHYRVDLRNAEYLDSSALGQLLLLRQHAGGSRERVILLNPRGQVRNLLELAGFPSMFNVDSDIGVGRARSY